LAVALLSAMLCLQGCGGPTKRVPPAPRFSHTEIEASYKNGEDALLNGDYVKARRVLMQIISRYPGENDLAQVQWLIAKTYDLERRPLEAVAEYKRFLANYPDHPNAQDADERIRRLGPAPKLKPNKPVRVLGTLSTDYEYAKDVSPDSSTWMNRLTTRFDAQVRNLDNGQGKVIISALRSFDLEDSRDDRARLQKLYGDWHDVSDTFSLRLGRQPSTAGSLSTRYDGAEFHYRIVPSIAFDAAAGFPVDFTRSGSLSTDARFYETGFDAASPGGTTGRMFAVRQYANDTLDREAFGANVQGVWGPLGVNGNVDYDASFGDFNDRFLLLEYAMREEVHLTLARDLRNDPYLQMSTALQDPTATTAGLTDVTDLVGLLGESAVRDLARNHTINSTDTRVGVRWTVGPHWLTTADYSHTVSSIPDTITAVRTDRTSNRVSLYASQSNAWRVPDNASALLIYQTSSDLTIDTLSLVAGERITPQLLFQFKTRIEYTNFKNGGSSDSLRYVPGFVVNLDPKPFLSITAEGEYTHEDNLYSPGRKAILSRLNVTVIF
jgi:tetratricopeptide (TPR) repeat protein